MIIILVYRVATLMEWSGRLHERFLEELISHGAEINIVTRWW